MLMTIRSTKYEFKRTSLLLLFENCTDAFAKELNIIKLFWN